MCVIQGRTGIVFNVSPRAVGVIIHKVVGNRYMEKRVNIRCEHVRHSKCREDFIRRVKENAQKKKEAKASGEQVNLKRIPALPRVANTIQISKENAIETLRPIAYDTVSSLDIALAMSRLATCLALLWRCRVSDLYYSYYVC